MLVVVKWDIEPNDNRFDFMERNGLPDSHEVPEDLAAQHDALMAENKTAEAELLIGNWISSQYDYTFVRWTQFPE